MRSKQLEKIEASQSVINSIETYSLPNNLEEIRQTKTKLQEELSKVKSISNYPTSAYDNAQ